MKSKKTNTKRQVVSHTVHPVVGPELTGITLKFKSGPVELTVEEAKTLYAALESIFGPTMEVTRMETGKKTIASPEVAGAVSMSPSTSLLCNSDWRPIETAPVCAAGCHWIRVLSACRCGPPEYIVYFSTQEDREAAIADKMYLGWMPCDYRMHNAPLHLQGGATAEPCKRESGCSQED